MPKSWEEALSAMVNDGRDEDYIKNAKQEYWFDVVAPKMQSDGRDRSYMEDARRQFFSSTSPRLNLPDVGRALGFEERYSYAMSNALTRDEQKEVRERFKREVKTRGEQESRGIEGRKALETAKASVKTAAFIPANIARAGMAAGRGIGATALLAARGASSIAEKMVPEVSKDGTEIVTPMTDALEAVVNRVVKPTEVEKGVGEFNKTLEEGYEGYPHMKKVAETASYGGQVFADLVPLYATAGLAGSAFIPGQAAAMAGSGASATAKAIQIGANAISLGIQRAILTPGLTKDKLVAGATTTALAGTPILPTFLIKGGGPGARVGARILDGIANRIGSHFLTEGPIREELAKRGENWMTSPIIMVNAALDFGYFNMGTEPGGYDSYRAAVIKEYGPEVGAKVYDQYVKPAFMEAGENAKKTLQTIKTIEDAEAAAGLIDPIPEVGVGLPVVEGGGKGGGESIPMSVRYQKAADILKDNGMEFTSYEYLKKAQEARAEENALKAMTAEGLKESGAGPEDIKPYETPSPGVEVGKVKASPSTMKLMKGLEVDPTQVKGTGKNGYITAKDVKAYVEGGRKVGEAITPPATGMIRVYRGQSVSQPGMKPLPDWIKPHIEGISGRWWTTSIETAQWYLNEAMVDGGRGEIVYQDIPQGVWNESVASETSLKWSPRVRKEGAPLDEAYLPVEYKGKGKPFTSQASTETKPQTETQRVPAHPGMIRNSGDLTTLGKALAKDMGLDPDGVEFTLIYRPGQTGVTGKYDPPPSFAPREKATLRVFVGKAPSLDVAKEKSGAWAGQRGGMSYEYGKSEYDRQVGFKLNTSSQTEIKRTLIHELLHHSPKWRDVPMTSKHPEDFYKDVWTNINDHLWASVEREGVARGEARVVETPPAKGGLRTPQPMMRVPPTPETERTLPSNTSEGRKSLLGLPDRYASKLLEPLFKRAYSLLPSMLKRPFQQHPLVSGAYSEYQGIKAKGAEDVLKADLLWKQVAKEVKKAGLHLPPGVIELVHTNRSTPEDKIITDFLHRGWLNVDDLPPGMRPVVYKDLEHLRTLAQSNAMMMESVGIPIRKEWAAGPKSYYPNMFPGYGKEEGPTSIMGRLFNVGKKSLKYSPTGLGQMKMRYRDFFTVWQGKEMKGAFTTKDEAVVEMDKLYKANPKGTFDIVEPATPEVRIGLGLCLDAEYNVKKGFTEQNNNIALTHMWDRMGQIMPEEGMVLDSPEKGFTPFKSLGITIPDTILNENPNVARLYNGFVRNDLALNISALVGRRSVFGKMLYGVESVPRAFTTWLNPIRYPKQIIENEVGIAMGDPVAFFDPRYRALQLKYGVAIAKSLKTGVDPDTQYYQEAISLGLKDQTWVGHVNASEAESRLIDSKFFPGEVGGKLHDAKNVIKATYSVPDLADKIAYFHYLREHRGLSPEKAYERVDGTFFNFRDLPPLVQKTRWIPYAGVTLNNFTRITAYHLRSRPATFPLQIGLLLMGLEWTRREMMERLGITADDIRQMGKMAPKKFQIPYARDEKGNVKAVDLTSIIPFTEASAFLPAVTEDTARAALSICPMCLRGPVASLFGVNTFGSDLYDKELDTENEKRKKFMQQFYQGMTPGIAGDTWRRMYRESIKHEDVKKPWWMAWTGGMIKQVNMEQAKQITGNKIRGEVGGLLDRMRSLQNRKLGPKEKEKVVKQIRDRIEEIQGKAAEWRGDEEEVE